ncbi:MAG: hypothetical protein COA86_05505 [Kangiella sp.]|nr:MAG: hypothetical protein COA86_05505 [Kangiella sp.]
MRITLLILSLTLITTCASPEILKGEAERIAATFGEPLSIISKDWKYSSLKKFLHPAVESEKNFSHKLETASFLGPVKECEPTELEPSEVIENAIKFFTVCHFKNGTAKVIMLGGLYNNGGSILFSFDIYPPAEISPVELYKSNYEKTTINKLSKLLAPEFKRIGISVSQGRMLISDTAKKMAICQIKIMKTYDQKYIDAMYNVVVLGGDVVEAAEAQRKLVNHDLKNNLFSKEERDAIFKKKIQMMEECQKNIELFSYM